MSEVRKEIINRLTKLSGTTEVDEISEEIKQISKRFNNGEETIEDILNHCRHYILKLENGRKLDLVEKKYLDKLIDKCKKLSAEREADKKRIEELKTDFKIVDQECSRLERKEAKQDKMIDLMAEFIENNTLNDVLIENVCLTLKCKNEECHEDNWKECIKQYFERRVEDETI